MTTPSGTTTATSVQGEQFDVIGIGGGTSSRIDAWDTLLIAVAAVGLHLGVKALSRRALRWNTDLGVTEALLFGPGFLLAVPALVTVVGGTDGRMVPKVTLAVAFLPWATALWLFPRQRRTRARVMAEISARSERLATEKARSIESIRAETEAARLEIERISASHPAIAERAVACLELEAARAELVALRNALPMQASSKCEDRPEDGGMADDCTDPEARS